MCQIKTQRIILILIPYCARCFGESAGIRTLNLSIDQALLLTSCTFTINGIVLQRTITMANDTQHTQQYAFFQRVD